MPTPEEIRSKLTPIPMIGNPVSIIAPLPPSQDTTPDQIGAFYRPVPLPFTRHSPLPVAANAAAGAQSKSVAQQVVNDNVTNIINQTLAQIPPSTPSTSTGIPLPNTRRFSIVDFTPNLSFSSDPTTYIGATQMIATSGAGGGTITNGLGPDSGDGMFTLLTASTTQGAAGFITSESIAQGASFVSLYQMGRNLMMQTRARIPSGADQIKAVNWIAMTDQYGGNVASLSGIPPGGIGLTGNIIGFCYSTTAPNAAGWYGVCQGAGLSFVSLGVNDTLTHALQVSINDSAGTATFFVDGVQAGTIGTNLPAAGTLFGLFAGAGNSNTANTNMNIEYIYVERDY